MSPSRHHSQQPTQRPAALDKLERALRRAHATQETPPFSPEWTEKVMCEIRVQAIHDTMATEVPRLVWRAAAVIALVSSLFVGSILVWTVWKPDEDVSSLLTLAATESTWLGGEP